MANKFFSQFQDWINDSLSKGLNSSKATLNFDTTSFQENLKAVGGVFQETEKVIENLKEKSKELKKELSDTNLPLERRRELEGELFDVNEHLNDALSARTRIEESVSEAIEETTRAETDGILGRKRAAKSYEEVTEDFVTATKKINEAVIMGTISEEQAAIQKQQLNAQQLKAKSAEASVKGKDVFDKKIEGAGNSLSNALSSSGEGIVDQLSSGVEGALGSVPVAGKALQAAFKVGMAMADEFDKQVKAMRALSVESGGVTSAKNLGASRSGFFAGKGESISTIASNNYLDREELDKQISSLNWGNVISATQSIKDASSEIIDFSVQSAQNAKLYGVNFSEVAENYISTIGGTWSEATNLMNATVGTAQDLGLNAQTLTKNLGAATKFSKDFTFNSLKGMQKLSLAATELGIKTEDLLGLTEGLNTVNDVFEEQAKAQQLGFSEYAANLQRIQALTYTAPEEAAALKFQTIFDQLKTYGFGSNGNLQKEGKQGLQALGLTEQQMLALQNARKAELNGKPLDWSKLGKDIEESSVKAVTGGAEAKRQELGENMSLKEQFTSGAADVKNAILDGFRGGVFQVRKMLGQTTKEEDERELKQQKEVQVKELKAAKEVQVKAIKAAYEKRKTEIVANTKQQTTPNLPTPPTVAITKATNPTVSSETNPTGTNIANFGRGNSVKTEVHVKTDGVFGDKQVVKKSSPGQ